jgi:integral membrane protein
MKTIPIFRIIALAEGVSFLILLCIAMPLKYAFDFPQAVQIVGMLHGVLFVSFILLAWAAMSAMEKSYLWLLKAFALSIIPFGTFVLDRDLKKHQ